MVLWATILILQGASLVGSSTGIPGVPENITVMFLNPTSVRVSWSTSQVEQVEKYDVTYKPTDASYRVVAVVAGNSEAVTLKNLNADTQYQLVVTAVKSGKKLRSRPIVFRTLEPPRTSPQQDAAVTGGPIPPPPPPLQQQTETHIQVRGVEVGIVVLILMVWVGAIALFFNRWGKIRMLLPYQPDYKSEQLKVPGTGVCASANAAYTHNSSQHVCSQHLHWSNHHVDSIDSGGGGGGGGGTNWSKTTRPRVNSAIDVAGFLSQEFLRRHGSTSRLCRKVRSADNLPLASSNRQNSDPRDEGSMDGDRETFLKSIQDDSEKSDDTETQQNSLDNPKNEPSLLFDSSLMQHQSSRDNIASLLPVSSPTEAATTSIDAMSTAGVAATTSTSTGPTPGPSGHSAHAARRYAGWRAQAISGREYVRCPVRQPASVDERCYRPSCELVCADQQQAAASSAGRSSLPAVAVLPRHPAMVHHHHHHHHHLSQRRAYAAASVGSCSCGCESSVAAAETGRAHSCEHARRSAESSVEVQPVAASAAQHFGLPILSVSEPSPPDEVERADDYL